MTEQARFAKILRGESKAFQKVIEAITMPEYKHPTDPKIKTAMEMAVMLAQSAVGFATVLEMGTLGGENEPKFEKPADPAAASKVLAEAYEKAASLAEKADDATWDLPAAMIWNGKPVWEDTRGGMAWSLLLDAVHHRGQLATYLRPMGSKVPSIYGPSGDDMGGIEM